MESPVITFDLDEPWKVKVKVTQFLKLDIL